MDFQVMLGGNGSAEIDGAIRRGRSDQSSIADAVVAATAAARRLHHVLV